MEASPLVLQRAATYFALFVAGVVVAEAISHLTIHSYPLVMIPRLAILIALPILGGIFVGERHLLSRAVSASALFILAVIAIQFDEFPTYQLLLALIICCLGAQDFFHRRPKTTLRTVTYSLAVVVIALLFVVAIIAGMFTLNHLLINSHRLS